MKHRLILTLDPATFALDVDGDCANTDIAIAMLDQARRFFEGEVRKAQALQLQAQIQRDAENRKIAASLVKH